MSTLYLATDAELLAARLAKHLDQTARRADFFAPTTVVVTHRSLGKWLKMWLARNHGIAINLRVITFESSLWEMLLEVDPRKPDPPPELLDEDLYRLLVLSTLLEDRDPGLEYWDHYLQRSGAANRLFWRRLWDLSDRLGVLVRDYEYHRQDALIQHWLKDDLGLEEEHARLERAQQAVFASITREPDGKRARMNQATGRNFKTLPQYAMEVMELPDLTPPANPLRTLHLFGLGQFSALHASTLRWLGRFFDLHLYHFNPLARRLPQRPTRLTLQRLAQKIVEPGTHEEPCLHLLRSWSRSGAESLRTMAQVLADAKTFRTELLDTPRRETDDSLFAEGPPTVLARLQDHLLHGHASGLKLTQDRSLQIVGCPGMVREVETVHQSILANMNADPGLRQSDIAVLVTDMDRYRPALRSVFERPAHRLRYSVNITAAGVSTFAQALLGMIDLALEAFTRSQVFAVLLNPCFLARLGVDRSQALVWLDWAQALSIHQGWDQADKGQRGYAESPNFSWRLGLQRLRLGRIMEVAGGDSDEPLPRFGPVVPFADLHSGDPDQLNAFCLAVEGLLPRLAKLRHARRPAREWVDLLQKLMKDFLQVPADRPEEAEVWDRIVRALHKWLLWDPPARKAEQPLPLPLVRQMVQSVLENIEGLQGDYLSLGVTIAPLLQVKPVPFRVVYVLGLGEDLFPGNNGLSGLDLRGAKRVFGDIRPAEFQRGQLLEAVLSARDKLYLLYQNLNVQKDQKLHPSVPVQQLKSYLAENVLSEKFQEVEVPLLACDEKYLRKNDAPSDVLVQFAECERLLAIDAGRASGLVLTAKQNKEVADRLRDKRIDFALDDAARSLVRPVPTLRLRDLGKFLEYPVDAALRFHLHLEDEEEDEIADDEPFVTDDRTANRLLRQTLVQFILQAVRSDLRQALADWPQRFARVYEEWSLRGELPEEAFAQVDQAVLMEDLEKRIVGSGGLEAFLREHDGKTFCGPILIGESSVPIGAQQRFPALKLKLTRDLPQFPARDARLVGPMPLAWRSEDSLDVLVWNFKKKVYRKSFDKQIWPHLLEPVLFYLALRAGVDGSLPSTRWLGERALNVHIAHADAMFSFKYLAEDISPDQARAYLEELATDFLDPTQFDELPLKIILKYADLQRAYLLLEANVDEEADEYRDQFEDILVEEDGRGPPGRRASVSDLLEARVPKDAFAKVRRRFRLIDRGPARNRGE